MTNPFFDAKKFNEIFTSEKFFTQGCHCDKIFCLFSSFSRTFLEVVKHTSLERAVHLNHYSGLVFWSEQNTSGEVISTV